MKQQLSFIGKDDLTKRIVNFVKCENKRRNSLFNIELFQPEYVTQCERRIVYRALGYKPQIEITSRQFVDIKGKWVSIFMQMNDVSVLAINHEASDINNHIGGIIDIVIGFENLNMKSICMVRPVSNETFEKIKINGALRRDVLADMMYMWLVEIPNALIIYENVDSQEFEIFHLIPSNDYINTAKEKYRSLIPFKLKGELPERPKRCQSKDSKECSICEFRDECWKNK